MGINIFISIYKKKRQRYLKLAVAASLVNNGWGPGQGGEQEGNEGDSTKEEKNTYHRLEKCLCPEPLSLLLGAMTW